MPFLVVMPRAQAVTVYLPVLRSLHGVTSTNFWVGGFRDDPEGPNLLLARRWNGTAWENHDPDASVGIGGVRAEQIWANSTSNAWIWPLGNTRYWDGSAWQNTGVAGAVFAGDSDAPRTFQAADGNNPETMTWYDWTGSAWGSAQTATISPHTWTAWHIGPDLAFSVSNEHLASHAGDTYVLGGAGTYGGLNTLSLNFVSGTAGTATDHVFPGGGTIAAVYAPPGAGPLMLTQTGSVPLSILYQWDGSVYLDVGLPDLGDTVGFLDIHGVAGDDFWLIASDQLTVWYFVHFDGTGYSTYAAPAAAGNGPIRLWCVATDDVWAIGESTGGQTVWHYNGTSWTVQHVFTE